MDYFFIGILFTITSDSFLIYNEKVRCGTACLILFDYFIGYV